MHRIATGQGAATTAQLLSDWEGKKKKGQIFFDFLWCLKRRMEEYLAVL